MTRPHADYFSKVFSNTTTVLNLSMLRQLQLGHDGEEEEVIGEMTKMFPEVTVARDGRRLFLSGL